MNFEDAVAELYKEDGERDYFFISHAISRDLHRTLSLEIERNKKKDKATIFLNTYGGDPDGAFRIGRCLRHHYKGKGSLRIAIPHWCKSAGTLIAMVADDLGIGDFGELGPLDIQVYKGSELQERSSGLDITEAMGAVTEHIKESFHLVLKETRNLGLSTKLSAEFAAQVSAAIASPLFSQLDPLRFGELQRLTRIAEEYGNRLNQYGSNLKQNALDRLIHKYPSHNFVIDRKEAKELFERVGPLTEAEQHFCDSIWHLISSQSNIACAVIPPPAPSQAGAQDDNSSQPSNESANGSQQPKQGDSDAGENGLRARSSRKRRTQGSNTRTHLPN
ncbi:hypothetical protein GCM10027084_02170 [Pseudoxanthomonas sangjuensis]|uniref:SDH family Clp fold serine proteinase n=1 Tax=Pseudoxanthomonas sangjuensis TaxID=1503750 RepID=UPI001391E019|nr:hypothetical protein [Pseudoxanthomonas sangjuensis]